MDPLRYAFVALQDNHWSEVQQPIVSGSIPEKVGEVVNTLINNLLNKIPFLAPSSPTPAPSGIGGIVSNLVGSVTGSAGNIVKVRMLHPELFWGGPTDCCVHLANSLIYSTRLHNQRRKKKEKT